MPPPKKPVPVVEEAPRPVTPPPAPPPTLHVPELLPGLWHSQQVPAAANCRAGTQRLPFTGRLRNDYLLVCRYLGLQPHPSLLHGVASSALDASQLPSVSIAARLASPSSSSASQPVVAPQPRRVFDLALTDDLALRDTALSHQPLCWADAHALGCALRSARHLHTLKLWQAGLTAAALVELARVLPATAVTTLCLENNPLPPSTPAEALSLDPHVAEAWAAAAAAAAEETEAAAEAAAVAEAPAVLEGGGSEAAPTATSAAAAPPLPPMPSTLAQAWGLLAVRASPLHHLSLRGNGLDAAAAAALGTALAFNTRLTHLDLSLNPLGEAGMLALCAGLQHSSAPLRFLGLSAVGAGAVGASALGTVLCGVEEGKEGEEGQQLQLQEAASELAVGSALQWEASGHLDEAGVAALGVRPVPVAVEAAAPPPEPVAAAGGKKGGKKGEQVEAVAAEPPPPPPPPPHPKDVLKFGPGRGSLSSTLLALDFSMNPEVGVEGVVALARRLLPEAAVEQRKQRVTEAEAEGAAASPADATADGATPVAAEGAAEAAAQPAEAAAAAAASSSSHPLPTALAEVSLYRCSEGGVVAGLDVELLDRAALPALATVGGVSVDLTAFARVHQASSASLERRAAVFQLRGIQESGQVLGVSVLV